MLYLHKKLHLQLLVQYHRIVGPAVNAVTGQCLLRLIRRAPAAAEFAKPN